MTWIQTYRGRAVELMAPQPEDIDPTELAILLGRLNRFGGHTLVPYTVAEHSVRVAQVLQSDGHPRELVLAGLLHDAHEGYLGCDISTPLKGLIGSNVLGVITTAWDVAVARRFGIDFRLFGRMEVEWVDGVLLATERRDLLRPEPQPWRPLPPPLEESISPMRSPAVEFARMLAAYTGESIDPLEVEAATLPAYYAPFNFPNPTPRRGLAGAVCGAPELSRREQ